MSDSAGGVGGVGGTDSASSAGKAAEAAAQAAAQMNAVDAAAEAMVDAATTPAGVDVESLAEAVATLQANPATAAAATALQASIEAQLSPVAVGQLQAAIDRTVSPSITQAINASPLAGLAMAPAGLFNAAGQAIDACGNVVAQVTDNRAALAREASVARALEHVGRITGGPISGPVYAGALALGASDAHLDRVHEVGKVVDGAFEIQNTRVTEAPPTREMPYASGYTQR